MQLRQLNVYMEELRNALTLVQTLQCSDTRERRMRLMIGAAACAIGCLSILPRMNDCPCRPRRLTSAFTATEFRGHFKFERHDFYRVLQAMRLTQQRDQGSPLWLRVGPPGKQSVVPSDWAFMVLMKRMATGNRYRDVSAVVGGNKTELCVTFLHMRSPQTTTVKLPLTSSATALTSCVRRRVLPERVLLPECVLLLERVL